jgi:hypothetical protein
LKAAVNPRWESAVQRLTPFFGRYTTLSDAQAEEVLKQVFPE